MPRRAFITGIGGFIGRALADRLRREDIEVTGLSRSGTAVPGCKVLAGEVVHPAAYSTDMARSQLVVHLAAPTLASEINGAPIEAMKVNWRGAANVLDCFRGGEGEHLVLVSSGKVYGRPLSLPYDEGHPLNPTTVLGEAKRAAEDLVRFYARHTAYKRFSILRLFNAYGPGQRAGFLIPVIIDQLDKPEIILGDIHGRRDFIYIDDVVEALTTVLFNLRDPEGPSDPDHPPVRTFNVGSGESHSPADIVEALSGVVGRKLEVVVDEKRVRSGEPDEERAGIEKLKALSWEPRVGLADGLLKTWRASGSVSG